MEEEHPTEEQEAEQADEAASDAESEGMTDPPPADGEADPDGRDADDEAADGRA